MLTFKQFDEMTNPKAYAHAANVLQNLWDRKKKDGKHDLGYYAAQIARQYAGMDSRKLSKMIDEGSESWEDGYERRVVKTTKPEHKEKGYNWRIKGKDRDEISIKLYKEKPDFAEFKKQMKRVAGHEFGG